MGSTGSCSERDNFILRISSPRDIERDANTPSSVKKLFLMIIQLNKFSKLVLYLYFYLLKVEVVALTSSPLETSKTKITTVLLIIHTSI